jgi:hypothetical protein
LKRRCNLLQQQQPLTGTDDTLTVCCCCRPSTQAHFLPLALLSALLLGVSFPQLGLAAADLQIPTLTTTGIFIIQVRGGRGCCWRWVVVVVLGVNNFFWPDYPHT